jgi:predicted RNase H-like HicB family nuclease
MKITVELEQAANGKWIAEISDLPGVQVQGVTQQEALRKAQDLAFRAALVKRIDEVRERIAATAGPISDSTPLIREDRTR